MGLKAARSRARVALCCLALGLSGLLLLKNVYVTAKRQDGLDFAIQPLDQAVQMHGGQRRLDVWSAALFCQFFAKDGQTNKPLHDLINMLQFCRPR